MRRILNLYPADVGAELHICKGDMLGSAVNAVNGVSQGGAGGGDAQHTAAGGEDLAVLVQTGRP